MNRFPTSPIPQEEIDAMDRKPSAMRLLIIGMAVFYAGMALLWVMYG